MCIIFSPSALIPLSSITIYPSSPFPPPAPNLHLSSYSLYGGGNQDQISLSRKLCCHLVFIYKIARTIFTQLFTETNFYELLTIYLNCNLEQTKTVFHSSLDQFFPDTVSGKVSIFSILLYRMTTIGYIMGLSGNETCMESDFIRGDLVKACFKAPMLSLFYKDK